MKASDYIVEYLIGRGITDIFGYPGGMVTHLMDSLQKYSDRIHAHVMYHEQGAAFAACGFAQAKGGVGVAYATSGPGATNLITGICDAYFDSVPAVFLTGQVNTFEGRGDLPVRQRGFQETDIVSMVCGVTKYAAQIRCAQNIRAELDRAFDAACSGRPGPALLDIPMDVFRAEVDPAALAGWTPPLPSLPVVLADTLRTALQAAQRPVLLLGNGVRCAGAVQQAREAIRQLGIPVLTTMPAVDVPGGTSLNYGFLGAYGSRTANFIAAKSDLILAIGARLDVRQVGARREAFAPDAKVVRIDIDAGELSYHVHPDELAIQADAGDALCALTALAAELELDLTSWRVVCDTIRSTLDGHDLQLPGQYVQKLREMLPVDAVITTDVGQNQVWAAQELHPAAQQRVLFSAGHGAMGYALPAAIGACFACKKTVICLCGDGGLQMNIQELQVLARDQLPIKLVVFNNHALGMIRHFQEMYFEGRYTQTTAGGGYCVPALEAIAKAYRLAYHQVYEPEMLRADWFADSTPTMVEIQLPEQTFVYPKLEFGKPNQDQFPLLSRAVYQELMAL